MAGIWSGEDVEPFAELLRRLRLAAGLTQESLAEAAGVSVDAVGTLERGARLTPRMDTVRLLANALGLDGEDRQRFLSVSAPHPRQPKPTNSAWPAAGRFPQVRSPVPVPLTPLVGRAKLVDRVGQVVAAGPRRLVTLTGPGGVGKTRVALAVADADPQLAGWVDLAVLREPADLMYAVAEAVGLAPKLGVPPMDALAGWAAHSPGLLVLDNCEHLLDAVADLVARLLAGPAGPRAPTGPGGVRVLATSRERLAVPGEQVLVVPPLALPAPGSRDPEAAAVRLFAERAAQAAPGFALDAATLDRVGGICRALDGLPLAIELAAARIGTLTVDDLASRLDAGLDLLAARRGADPRHHTLRSVIDWSYQLLTEAERLLFARLHVFAGEFDLAAAQTVAADDRVPAAQIPHLVALLADRSMLTRPGHAGIGHYRMLETLRTYAADRLSPQELAELRRAHARYIIDMAEAADTGLTGPDEAIHAERIERWLDDARAAFAWARDAGETDLAMRLAAAPARYAAWRMRLDVLAWGESLVEAVHDHPLLPTVYAAAAAGAWLAGRLEEKRVLARRSIASAGGVAALGVVAPVELGVVCAFLEPYKGVEADYVVSVWPLSNLRDAALGDVALLKGEVFESLSACRALTASTDPDTASRAIGLAGQALALADLKDPAAWSTAREAVAHARASGNPSALAFARFTEGKAAADDDPLAALAVLDDARSVAADVDCRAISTLALTLTVVLRGRHGPVDEALTLFQEVIGAWRAAGNETLLVALLSNLVILLARIGRDAEAVDLAATLRHAAHTAVYGIYGAEVERIDTILTGKRRRLGAQRYDAAWSAGARRSVDEAADRAQHLLQVAGGPVGDRVTRGTGVSG
jgi:predicted ATPase/DNA-binding XRE family transcriptional regulator